MSFIPLLTQCNESATEGNDENRAFPEEIAPVALQGWPEAAGIMDII
jgi:hypothetical protein